MIKLENVKVFNFEGAFRGLRNPMNSWHLSDSIFGIMDENEIDLAIEEVAENYSLSEKIHKPYEEASQFLYENGVKLIAMRCAGYNNVDIKYAFGKIHVLRVPAYSPYAVAEHAIAMLLTSIRRIHKAYIRTRDFNFSLNNFTGFDLHGKTVGVVGTGKIGRVFIDICKGFGHYFFSLSSYRRNKAYA